MATINKSNSKILIVAGLLWASWAQAQESMNTIGSNATGSGGSASYSIGQVVYTTNFGSSGCIAQGVQHAYEIFSVGVNETALNISLTAFPNPTTDNLTLEVKDFKNEQLTYQLYDIEGKLLRCGQVAAHQTQINTSSLSPSTYLVIIINLENKNIQSFKVIKR